MVYGVPDIGYDQSELVSAVGLWRDASMTTHNVEKGHKACAVMLDAATSGMGMERIVSQGLLNSLRLQVEDSKLHQSMALLQKQLTYLERCNPNKV